MTLLTLNDGWTQIPPKQDGVYWFQCAKAWHSENAYDNPVLVRLANGKRVEEMDDYERKWIPPDYAVGDDPTHPAWDPRCQFHMLAAWRRQLAREDFSHLPPKITGIVFEREPAICKQCNCLGAIYHVWQCGGNEAKSFLFVCYACNHTQIVAEHGAVRSKRFWDALETGEEAAEASGSRCVFVDPLYGTPFAAQPEVKIVCH